MPNLPTTNFDGIQRSLAVLTPYPRCAMPEYAVSYGEVDKSEWVDVDLAEQFGSIVKDQLSSSACGAYAGSTASELAWKIQGKNPQEFSPWFLYAQANGGRDDGVVLSDAVTAMTMIGIALEGQVPFGTLQRNRIDSSVYKTAERFRLENAHRITGSRGFDLMCSAVQRFQPVVFGMNISQNLQNTDSEGVVPLPNRFLGGHAMTAVGVKWFSSLDEWLLKVQNNWGRKFGINGFCYMREIHLRTLFEAFALQSQHDDPQDPNDEPPAVRSNDCTC